MSLSYQPRTLYFVGLLLVSAGCAERAVESFDDREGEPCEQVGVARACGIDEGQVCDGPAGELVWQACVDVECTLGDREFIGQGPCGDLYQECAAFAGSIGWVAEECEEEDEDECDWNDDPDCDTPLVIEFDGESIEMSPAGAATFEMSPGGCTSTDWPTATTPWLAIDLDKNGDIDGGHELFGSGSLLPSGERARNGFEALGALDTDDDGRITANDDRFGELVMWRDHDGDRQADFSELDPLMDEGIVAIDLGFERETVCDGRGNCGIERALAELGGGRRAEVVDLWLPCR
jgi:hypothetical protein